MMPTVRPHMMYYICGIISLACGVEIYTTHAPLFECVTHWLMAIIYIHNSLSPNQKKERGEPCRPPPHRALQFIT